MGASLKRAKPEVGHVMRSPRIFLPVLYRNNVRVRNVRNIGNVRNMFGASSFGTFGQHWPKIIQNASKSPQNNKSRHAEIWGCQFSFWFRMVTSNAASGYVAKISMLRLTIGSGMLRLSSCMLSIGRGPKAVQGKGRGAAPPCLVRIWVQPNAENA